MAVAVAQLALVPTVGLWMMPGWANDNGDECIKQTPDTPPETETETETDPSTDPEAEDADSGTQADFGDANWAGSEQGAAGDTGSDAGDIGDGGGATDGIYDYGISAFDSAGYESFDAGASFNGGGGSNWQYSATEYAMSRGVIAANTTTTGIELPTANKREMQVSYVSQDPAPLRAAAVYNSNAGTNPAQTTLPMGVGWRHYYDRSVQVLASNQVRLHRANGKVLDFTLSGGAWVSSQPTGRLVQVSGGWQYINHRDQIELYNSAGRLASLSSGGRVKTLQYDAAGRLQSVSNPYGRSLQFAYDAAGRLSTTYLPGGKSIGYVYDSANNLSAVRQTDNSLRQYRYEQAGLPNALTGVVDETGQRLASWAYDGAGRPNVGYRGQGLHRVDVGYTGDLVTTLDARGTLRSRSFAQVGGRRVLTALTTGAHNESAARTWSFGHDARGNMSFAISPSGEVQQLSADAAGRTLSVVRAAGTGQTQTAQLSWHPIYRKRTQVSAAGVTRNATLDDYGRLTALNATGRNGVTQTLHSRSYNAQHLLQQSTDARGATTTYGYDAAGNRTSITNPLGQTIYLSNHDADGRARTITLPSGAVITKSFDARGRLVSRSVAGRTTTFSYDPAGRLSQTTLPDGGWRRHEYDSAGQRVATTNHRNELSKVWRDADGRVSVRAAYNSAGGLATVGYWQYNGHGKLASTIDANSQRTVFSYGADGRPVSVSNPLGHTITQQLDLLNRPVAITQPNTTAMRQAGGASTVSTAYSYEATSGALQTVTDTAAVSTGYAYDAYNRSTAEAGLDAGNQGWVRNVAGDVSSLTNARGFTFTMARDALGRTTSITPSSGTAINFGYAAGQAAALPATMSDGSGSTAWSYDAAGRVLSKAQTISGLTRTVSYARDAQGRVTTMSYPSGAQVSYTYNANGVASISVNGTLLLNNLSYRPMSSLATGWSWGNGASYSRQYNNNGQVSQVSLGSKTRSYTYDAAGRIVALSDQGPSGTQTSSLAYDEAGQLTSYSGPQGAFSYGYDTNGNRRTFTQNGATYTNTYAAGTNRILRSPNGSYSYGSDGNPTSDGYYALRYDAYGRFTAMESTGEYKVSRLYSGQGYRVQSLSQAWRCVGSTRCIEPKRAPLPSAAGPERPLTIDTTSTADPPKGGNGRKDEADATLAISGTYRWVTLANWEYVHNDDGQLLGEYDRNGGNRREHIWFNGQPVAVLMNGTTLYHVYADHLATPRAIRRASDNLEVWRWDSEPFGNTFPTNPAGSGAITYNLRFPGQQYDPDTGYHYNVMRDYNPATGRYIQADPIGLQGGLSRYGYVGGNPISDTDPEGLQSRGLITPGGPGANLRWPSIGPNQPAPSYRVNETSVNRGTLSSTSSNLLEFFSTNANGPIIISRTRTGDLRFETVLPNGTILQYRESRDGPRVDIFAPGGNRETMHPIGGYCPR